MNNKNGDFMGDTQEVHIEGVSLSSLQKLIIFLLIAVIIVLLVQVVALVAQTVVFDNVSQKLSNVVELLKLRELREAGG